MDGTTGAESFNSQPVTQAKRLVISAIYQAGSQPSAPHSSPLACSASIPTWSPPLSFPLPKPSGLPSRNAVSSSLSLSACSVLRAKNSGCLSCSHLCYPCHPWLKKICFLFPFLRVLSSRDAGRDGEKN